MTSASSPIIPGFAPDPSICLIEGTYYLVNSSFHLFPGLPIYSSHDLASWTHIDLPGNAISRPPQLSLSGATTFIAPWDDGTPMLATGGLYAPTIRHYNGVTYIICTNVIHGPSGRLGDERSEQFIVRTDDIRSGKWSNPVVFPFPGIDPSLLFDDGKVYVQVCKTGPQFQIFNFEINIDTGEMLTDPILIWKGWAKKYTEGPHVYKKDGWYYLLCAEGGTFRYHMLSVARSKSIWGPFESYHNNPIYTADGTDRYVQNVGHGDLFQDRNGHWWAVVLGIRMVEGRSILGRETFLAAAEWPDDGWPAIKSVPAVSQTALIDPRAQIDALSETAWVYLRDSSFKHTIQQSQLKLRSSQKGLSSTSGSVSFVGQRQRSLSGAATVTLSLRGNFIRVQAGLALYKDEHRYLTIAYSFENKNIVFEGRNTAQLYEVERQCPVTIDESVEFKMIYMEKSIQFLFKPFEGEWKHIQEVDTVFMTDYDFTGPVIGVFAIGDEADVEFTDFDLGAT
ncbi:Concanavalin A-like lectin/glucanase subgroup [Penicillium verhagenii]|nr:Concanavalin A-like lectin/glucanase subgroup [Penicillium verhagenii]